MRITCPNCTAHFEIPSELLGRKGRSLKCANCGHSWYQTPQVETIDLAEIMGEEYAARARADMGAPAGRPMGAPPTAQQSQQKQPPQQQQPRPQTPPGQQQPQMRPQRPGVQAAPMAAVSLMGGQGQQPGQRPAGQQRPAAPPSPSAPSWYQQQPPPGAQGGPPPGSASWYQQQPPPGAQGAPPPGSASWYQQQPPPGAQGQPPGAASWYQKQEQPRDSGPPPGAPTWYQQRPGAAPGQRNVQGAPMGMAPPPGGPSAAPLPGQSLMGAAAAPGPQVGGGAVSWVQQPGAFVQPPQAAAGGVLNYAQNRPGAPIPGQSVAGQAQVAAPGEAAVSWVQQPGMQVPLPGQSMQHQGPGGPGAMGVSQMGHGIAAPGQGAHSMMSGQHIAAPGMGAQSMVSGQQIAAPGQAAHSLLDGTVRQPGAAGQSVLQNEAGGANAGASVMQHEAGLAAPGIAMQADQAAGGAQADPGQQADQAGAAAAAAEAEKAKTEATLVTEEHAKKDDPTLTEEAKKEGKAAPLWASASEDEELVDPNADRPDFGASAEAEAEGEEEAGAEDAAREDEEDEEDAQTLAAAGEKPPPVKIKPRREIDPAYITAGLMAFALICVGVVLWTQRAALARLWPGFEALYEKAGLAPKNPGDGLRLTLSQPQLRRTGGIETLVMKGYISNIGQTSRDIPGLKLQIINVKNEVLQETKGAAPVTSLDPGGSVDFEIRLELPDTNPQNRPVVSWDSG